MRGEQRPAGLGLPVVVDHRAAERLADPDVRRLVERLAGEEEVLERGEVVLLQVGRVLLLQHADRGRRGEHHRHLVVLHDLPPDARVGTDRHALVQDGRHAGDQRPVDDVGVPHHPADVGGGEHGLARARRRRCASSTRRAPPRSRRRRAARPSACRSCPRYRGCRKARSTRARRTGTVASRCFARELRPVDVAARRPIGIVRVEPAAEDQHLLRRVLGELERLVHQRLVEHDLAHAAAAVGGDHERRPARRRCAPRGSPRRSRRTPPSGSRRCARRRGWRSTASGIIGM